MVVDFHTHIFPDKIANQTVAALAQKSSAVLSEAGILNPYTTGSVASLLEEMKRSDVDLSVALPVVTNPKQFTSIARFAQMINEQYYKDQKGVLSFGGVHPESANYKEELRELKRMGIKGIKLHPDYQGPVYFNDIRYKRIVDEASNQDMIIVVHAGVDVGLPEPVHCPVEMSYEILKEVQPPKMVLAHLGGWLQWDQVEELLVGQDVYMDLAVAFDYCSDEQIARIIENHGAERILFATDSPWTGQKESIERLDKLMLKSNARERILYQNALELLHI